MPHYDGQRYSDGRVSIGTADVAALRAAALAPDVGRSVLHWSTAAAEQDTIISFGVYWRGQLVGQILLHDIDRTKGEALVAYHLFDPGVRGQGIGTRALRLLVQFVEEQTDLTLLTSITSRDNIASRRIALKCGFREVGAPREDPLHGVVYQLPVPARSARSG